MNLLLWVYLTLQINFPLFNISSQQTPGYDYMGGPRLVQHIAPVLIPKVAPISKYYTCPSGIWIGRNPCKFHNSVHTIECVFTVSYGHNIPCTQWRGVLI